MNVSHRALVVKNPPTNAGDVRCQFNPWVRRILWKREWHPTPVFLTGELHGQSSLEDYSPWGQKESHMTEVTQHTCTKKGGLCFLYSTFKI